MAIADRVLYPQLNVQRIIPMILWPISIMMVLHRSVILGVNGDRTDDFTPVYQAALRFLNQQSVYGEAYQTVEPHYLYPPSGTLLMAPLAVIDPERSRWLFITFSVIALIVCAYLLTMLFGFGWRSWVFPTVLFFFFSTETVAHTLIFTNYNSFVLLGMLAFMILMLRNHQWWAGVPLGLTLAVKPVLAPLLLLPLLNRQWRILVTAVGVPAALMALAWPVSVDPMDFVKRTYPYLQEVRDYYNSSIGGNGLHYGLDSWLILVLRVGFGLIAVFSLWFLYRYYRKSDPLLWLTTSSGVLLCTWFLVGPLGQGYYSMLLFPLVMSVFLPGSPMRNWPAWLAVYGCFTFDNYISTRWEPFGRALEYNKVTWGWSLLMIAVFCSLLFRYLDLRKAGQAGPFLEEFAKSDAPSAQAGDESGRDASAVATLEK